MIYKKLSIAAGGGIIDQYQQAEQEECANVFIGLGGTGISCLKEVKKQVYNRLKPDPDSGDVPRYDHIQFLAIDGDPLDQDDLMSSLDNQSEFVPISIPDIHAVLNNARVLRAEPNLQWLDDGLKIHDAVNGLGGVRQAGRLAVMMNCSRIVNTITSKINCARTGLIDKPLNIHIFTGMGGGTGSGTFLDICYIIHHILEELSLLGTTEVCGYFFLPDVNLNKVALDAVKQYIQINGFAAMKELDYCMNFDKNGGEWSQKYDGFTVKTTDKPVTLAHLITAADEKGSIKPNGYDYAMNVVADYVMEFVTKQNVAEAERSTGNFGLKSHIANIDGIVPQLKKKRGAGYCYCVLGASHAYMPYKDINSYMAARIFEAYRTLPTTNHDINSFVNENSLTYRDLLNAINKEVKPVPIFEVDTNTLIDQVKGIAADVIPPVLSRMTNSISTIEGDLTTNRESQLKSVIVDIKNKLIEVATSQRKGPYYASLFLNNTDRASEDLSDIINGYIKENNKNLAQSNANMELRISAMESTLSELQNARLHRNRRANAYVSAVHSYYSEKAKIALYKEMGDFLNQLKLQIQDLYESFFVPVNSMLSNVAETFNQNYKDLADKATVNDDYAIKIIGIDDEGLKKSLDLAVESIDTSKVVNEFISYMIRKSDDWLGQSEDSKICAAVSSFFIQTLSEFTHKNIDFYLQEKFQVAGQKQLADKIYKEIMRKLQDRAKPLFWASEPLDTDSRMGYCSIPDTSDAIEAAADLLHNNDKQIDKRKSIMPDRISMLIFYCGVPMFKFKGSYNYKPKYEGRSERGCHLYEGFGSDKRNFATLHNIVPLSQYSYDEVKEDVKVFIDNYKIAVDLGIVHKEQTDTEGKRFEYQLRTIDLEDLGDKKKKIDRLLKEKNIEHMRRFLDDEDNLALRFTSFIVLPNTGYDTFRDAVVEDYVYASLYYRAILNEQLKIAADYNKLKGELAKIVKDNEREDENLQSFVNALCTGIIKMENKFTFKYSREDDGFVDWYELTGVDTKPFGDSLPLYSAYIEFCRFDQDYIDEFNKISRNRQINDEDTCLECTKLIKDYLFKRADIMKEIADDQFRSKRREIYKFVEALTRLIKSFERKLL